MNDLPVDPTAPPPPASTAGASVAPDAIAVSDVFKVYRRLFQAPHAALNGVSLRIPKGSAFGLIGPNGAGKTTFIKVMLGIAFADAGEVRLLGKDPEDPSARAKVGYLPERLELPAAATPRQHLRSLARLKSVAAPELEIERWLTRLGLTEAAGRAMGEFSKGMRQRVGLAAGLLGSPELLVLDEPTDGLDPLARVEVRTLLAEERARGCTLFLNSHLLTETERICDRVAILARGKILREGSLAELRASAGGYRVRFENAGPAELVPLGFLAVGGNTYQFQGNLAEVNAAVDRARAGGALLLELLPGARDLEELLSATLAAA